MIVAEVWGDPDASDAENLRVFDLAAAAARSRPIRASPELIVTEPGVGYRFLPGGAAKHDGRAASGSLARHGRAPRRPLALDGPPPEFHPQGFAEVACFALRDDLGTILVDPLLPRTTRRCWTALDASSRAGVRILITVPYHVRSSEALWQRYRDRYETTIHGHPRCANRLEDDAASGRSATGAVIDGDIVPNRIGHPRRDEGRCGCRPTARWRSATRSSTWTASCGCGTSRWTASGAGAGTRIATCRRSRRCSTTTSSACW